MNITEWVQQSRQEQRQLFGQIEIKEDCEYYCAKNGKVSCRICKDYTTGRDYFYMQCKMGICYFYKPKE